MKKQGQTTKTDGRKKLLQPDPLQGRVVVFGAAGGDDGEKGGVGEGGWLGESGRLGICVSLFAIFETQMGLLLFCETQIRWMNGSGLDSNVALR
ncbi:MAG: hypothetical protein ACLFQQ_13700 [Desulfococcaceae bacterium]